MAEMLRRDPAESDAEPIGATEPSSAVAILTGCAESASSVASPPAAGVTEQVKAKTGPPRAAIVVSRNRGTVVVAVHGELDLPRAGDLGTTLADLIDGQGNLSVVVDLHDATASDADCLWVFTDAAERARRHGGMIKVSEPPGPISSALQLRGLDNFVGGIFDDS